MGATKVVNGVTVEMSPEEEAAFVAEQQDYPGRRAQLRAALHRAFEDRLRQGLEVDGHQVALDEASQNRLQWTFTRARDSNAGGGPHWPEAFAWRASDNAYLPLPSPEAAIAFCRRTAAEAMRLRMAMFDKKDALALTADAELDRFDPQAGWER
jgi:hypothetical protein